MSKGLRNQKSIEDGLRLNFSKLHFGTLPNLFKSKFCFLKSNITKMRSNNDRLMIQAHKFWKLE